ncbi:MAG: hypothetical protein NTW96_26695 [Planctomycetia bacterium]|nr:hypothetical protein [Planctomycetia bacterium]
MAPAPRGKQVVCIGTLPPDEKVRSPWDIPPRLLEVEVFDRNLTMEWAQGFVRVFNKHQLEHRLPDRKWAFVVKHARSLRFGEHPIAAQRREGGAL